MIYYFLNPSLYQNAKAKIAWESIYNPGPQPY